MHLCISKSSPQGSMSVSFSRPFQFKADTQSSKVCQESAESLVADDLKIP